MDAAPSLPDGVHALGLDTVPDADPVLMVLAHRGILDLALALNALLPYVGEHASNAADRVAATACTALAAELGDCYALGKRRKAESRVGETSITHSTSADGPSFRAGHRRMPRLRP